jgi:NAD(P)-dependent dehydrogenase (short-subunit alcohol dehydrogenase family)
VSRQPDPERRIINFSTDSDVHLGNTSCGASKHTLESYSRAAAHELSPHGVTSQGPVQTGFIDPETDQASRITGQRLSISVGHTM